MKKAASLFVPGTAAVAGIESMSCASPGNCSAGGTYTDGAGNRQVFVAGETSGTWGTAQEIPGTAALNAGGTAYVYSLSCASAGNCSAGGYYQDASGNYQAFVASETNGTWGTAEEVPGTAALNTGGYAQVESVSCASAGNCSAGGSYATTTATTTESEFQAFVVAETHGTWGTAVEVPGTAALNTGEFAAVNSVSCASAGNCTAGGTYRDSSGQQAFVASETDGTWGSAEEVPGTAALNTGGFAEVGTVSCASAGNCSTGGYYMEALTDNQEVFVVSETNGTWGTAEEVPGSETLNSLGYAQINSLSCASPGNCSAGGFYTDEQDQPAFVVSQTDGTWGTAQEVPGIAAVNTGAGQVVSVWCASAGNCSAAGNYTTKSRQSPAFTAEETNGTWGTAQVIPGFAALSAGSAQVSSMSCASAGNCSVGGTFSEDDVTEQAFATGETNGTWGRPIEVPGTAALNGEPLAQVTSVSCASAGNCLAAGADADSSGHGQAFVAAAKNGTWGTAQDIPGLAALNTGGRAQVNAVSCASAGNCSAGGLFVDSSGFQHGFVATETNGTWGAAQESPGANLNAAGYAQVTSVSCASPGNCSAGGQYSDRSSIGQAFVASATSGVWRTGKKVTGAAGFNAGGHAVVTSISCASAGNCSAAGFYTDASGLQQVFVVDETGGAWGAAQEIPGTAALNTGGIASVTSVSCASAGNCSAGGYYYDGNETRRAFVVNETSGAWGTAAQVSGTGGFAQVNSISCSSAGNCGAGGYYSASQRAFVVAETNGTWGTKVQVPGSAGFKKGEAAVETISCASPGNCSAGGYYSQFINTYTTQAFVATETNGTWNPAIKVPGTGTLNAAGYAVVTSVSCASAGNCSAGGSYFDSSHYRQAFVVNETNGTWASAKQIPGTAVHASPPGK